MCSYDSTRCAIVSKIILAVTILSGSILTASNADEFFVAPNGNDANSGSVKKPFATLQKAQLAARAVKKPVTVTVRGGTYYLPETLILGKDDSGVTWQAADNEVPVISGGMKLELQWAARGDGVYKAKTPQGLKLDQLFVNGSRQMMARYPNYDPDVRPYGGYSADAFSVERAKRWVDPAGGYIHAMHRAHWGGYHYRITGKNDKGEVTYEGGWQNNRQMGMHKEHRFVENIFEELDAPGEWFHDSSSCTLYYYPTKGIDISTAVVEVVRLRHLVEFNSAKNIVMRGFVFRHAARTFMDVKEPLLRSDWTIYRGGAVRFESCEDCTIADCEFDQMGGNAIFVNNYNRNICIRGCDIHDTGASAIAFVGDPNAVRNPLFEYGQRQEYADIDKTPGPKSENYPADCVVEDCLLRGFGLIEKQATGVEISMSMGIVIRHCSIYDGSRAGINVSEGTWGGHLIEFCDVFDTVRETGDHGSFNSWGRDRFWGLKNAPNDEMPQLALLDVVKPVTIRNSRWRCDHGWDVDLDDGSSNYEIYNNLFLNGGLKLREGFHRRVWNNITVNNSLHPHVWFDNCGDIVTNNIWMGAYRPAGGMPKGKWGREIDFNLFASSEADRTKFAGNGCDEHSVAGDPMFMNPEICDYSVKDGSPALKLGFKNFPMDQFGVQKPALRKIARTPRFPGTSIVVAKEEARAVVMNHYWQQAKVRNLEGEEYSAFGISKEAGGVQLEAVFAGSIASEAGLQKDDVIQSVNGSAVKNVDDLLKASALSAGKPMTITYVRSQAAQKLDMKDYICTDSELSTDGKFKVLGIMPASGVIQIKDVATRPKTNNERPSVLSDGMLAGNYGPVFGNDVKQGMYKIDLGCMVEFSAVRTWSYNQNNNRGTQHYVLFGSVSETDPGWDVYNVEKFAPVTEVYISSNGGYLVTGLRHSNGKPIGKYRWLVWLTLPVTTMGENTAYQELQVMGLQ